MNVYKIDTSCLESLSLRADETISNSDFSDRDPELDSGVFWIRIRIQIFNYEAI